VDGLSGFSATASNEFSDVTLAVPPRPERDGLVLALTASPPFIPGAGDRRQLGVQVDHIACKPDGRALPPLAPLLRAAAVTAVFAGTFALLGAPFWLASAGAAVIGLAQARPLVAGLALYTPYSQRLVPLAAGAGLVALAIMLLARRLLAHPPSPAARFALGYSAAAFYVLLTGLTHPSKALVDAVFHAHRLEWVHAGRYFFTQPMPDGVSFPYAIALYVASLPFMAFTRDHVTLLRVVVTAVHVLAGLGLYAVIARRRGDGLAAALAVMLWPLVPHWYAVVGNANMTNAFGQSVATAALASAVVWLPDRRTWWPIGTVFLLTLVAFLSHVSTFPLLGLALTAIAAVFVANRGSTLKAAGLTLGALTAAAALASVLLYYGHFTQVYQSLDRVRGRQAPAAQTAPAPPPAALDPTLDPTVATTRGAPTPGTAVRVTTAARVWVRAVGVPILLLALVGVWRLYQDRRLDALPLALAAWCAAGLLFLGFGVLAPVEPRFYRYMVEFIGRVFYASWPAVVILAGLGGAWGWRAGSAGRVAVTLAIGWAFVIGLSAWTAWFAVN
jgi:hypothetical protein